MPPLHRFLFITFIAVFAQFRPIASQTAAADDQLGQIISTIVIDSLGGGGATEGQGVFAVDSVSKHWLSIAKMDARIEPYTKLLCPGSVRDTATLTASRRGYSRKVEVKRSGTAVDRLLISKQCLFHYGGGRTRQFAEGGEWEIARRSGSWRIVRTVDHYIT